MSMHPVTRILSALEQGDPEAAEQLLPLVYDELRRLAAVKMAQEAPGQTLQATALVHDAYVRLVDVEQVQKWNSRGHFFAAVAEAMRRILIEKARSKGRLKHGGACRRIDLEEVLDPGEAPANDLLALDEALGRLEQADAEAAKLVKLRYFAGLTMPQAAEALGISLRSAERNWTYARTWLHRELSRDDTDEPAPGGKLRGKSWRALPCFGALHCRHSTGWETAHEGPARPGQVHLPQRCGNRLGRGAASVC